MKAKPLPQNLQNIKDEPAHKSDHDHELYSFYSDMHKDKHGFRPKDPNITVQQVWDWIQDNRQE